VDNTIDNLRNGEETLEDIFVRVVGGGKVVVREAIEWL
jgi:hypothetical protein